ncbi:hypothetical protein CYJ66_04615 [Gardnerella vaginalis]|nr:hypothetical protein EGX90_07270 [Gardnerella vaginalis]PKZ54028.1 hypothetical protein CYJ66_04615 [Gardnerella vaginalis]PKZ56139.1 hypothetical protein CYJ64_04615 [Gardnerella vaginalis]PKZ57573.1 hypothetical protein CYJ63_01085 [Gardnerella vaginalis]PKZ74596.1 hypothetical protein CYJ65_05035 [Gardnerella vaginalis]
MLSTLSKLSAPNCLRALRFESSGRSSRLRGEKYSNLAQQQIGNVARYALSAYVGRRATTYISSN